MTVSFAKLIKAFLLTVPLLAVLDLLWLGIVARGFYQGRLAHLLSSHVNWTAAVIFYFVYTAGIFAFAVAPNLQAGTILRTAAWGAALGLFAYGTYDLTNWATLRDWPVSVVIVDMAWGCVITAATAAAASALTRVIP